MKQYDEQKYRALGIGERIEKGDAVVRKDDANSFPPTPAMCSIGELVTEDDALVYLRPIEQELVASLPATPRKAMPVVTGVLDYFPDAIRAVANCSYVGNEQHNPGTPMHWDWAKSGDEADALVRHLMQRGTMDDDGVRHTTKVAWRALAMLQKELEEKQ